LRLHHGGDVAFRQGKDQIDRVGLGDHHDAGGVAAGDLVADIDLLQADAAVNRRGDAAPVELQLGAGDGGFVGFDRACVSLTSDCWVSSSWRDTRLVFTSCW
jgi:hypothetical protein